MDDGPGHWSQTPQKRKASSPAEDTQATQWKLLRSSNTATENTQARRCVCDCCTGPQQLGMLQIKAEQATVSEMAKSTACNQSFFLLGRQSPELLPMKVHLSPLQIAIASTHL